MADHMLVWRLMVDGCVVERLTIIRALSLCLILWYIIEGPVDFSYYEYHEYSHDTVAYHRRVVGRMCDFVFFFAFLIHAAHYDHFSFTLRKVFSQFSDILLRLFYSNNNNNS